MPEQRSILLHIGIHKTGTTALQTFLHERRAWLQSVGYDFYDGIYAPENHAELHGAAMRRDRRSPFRDFHRITDIDDLRRRTDARVAAFVQAHPTRNLIFSAEGLAYLRYEDEVRYVAELLDPRQTTIVVYLRDKAEFLHSYRSQLLRQRVVLSLDPDSYAYCETDSWLTDFDALLKAWSTHFRDIRVMRYDEIMARDGTIIPSFLAEIGLRGDHGPDARRLLNMTPPAL